jgi:hypothetical protein
MPNPNVTAIIRNGRHVLNAHPSIGLDAAGLLHALDQLPSDDRLHARAYLLHVYGLTVGITVPSQVKLTEWEHPPVLDDTLDPDPCGCIAEAKANNDPMGCYCDCASRLSDPRCSHAR